MQTEKEYLIAREISSLRCESVGEYSLPDYNGDVKKILTVKTKVFPSGKFVGEDSLEFSGTVGYEVVYLDSENNITHAEFSTDYDAAVKINSDTYLDSDVKTSVFGANVRLVGPRKLSVKCSLDNDVRIAEKRSHAIEGDAFMEYEPETLLTVANVLTPSFASGEAKEVNEVMAELDGAIIDEVEVLLSDARAKTSTLETGTDTLAVKGSVTVSVLLKNGEQMPRLISKELPYSEEISLADAEELESLEERVEISSLKTAVTPTEDGVSVSASVTLTPKLSGKKNCPIDLVSDSFLKERGTENEYSDFGYTEHVCTETEESIIEFKKSVSELGIENVGEVIYTEAQARVESCEILDEGVQIKGEVRFGGIVYSENENEDPIYAPVKFSVPFTENVNLDCQMHNNMRANCAVNANDAKINFDENSVYASCELAFYVTVTSEKRQRCLGASYLTDEEYEKDESVVTVYYPEPSESLFSIAKRFHTSVGRIAESNRLSESVFASQDEPLGKCDVKKLIIK